MLPSKYAPEGLSTSDQKKTITVGKPRPNRPIGVRRIEERVDNAVRLELQSRSKNGPSSSKVPEHRNANKHQVDHDGDLIMISMDDDLEVQTIANYVNSKRTLGELEDPMDIDDTSVYVEPEPIHKVTRKVGSSFLVVDTNFILSHLSILEELRKSSKQFKYVIIIPITVMKELDGLKNSDKVTSTSDTISKQSVGHLARWAIDWVYKSLAANEESIRGQKLKEKLDVSTTKDDAILDCCLYFQERYGALVVLLSNDKNFCMKALTNEVLTVSYRKEMTAKLIAEKVYGEAISRGVNAQVEPVEQAHPVHNPHQVHHHHEHADQVHSHTPYHTPHTPHTPHHTQTNSLHQPKVMAMNVNVAPSQPKSHHTHTQHNPYLVSIRDFDTATHKVFEEIQSVVISSIDYCMYKEYGEDIELIGYHKSNVTTLRRAADVMIRYWISVFSGIFPRSHKPFGMAGRKKEPIFVDIPRSRDEFRGFTEFWIMVLDVLYVGRDNSQLDALEKLNERWLHIVKDVEER